MYRVRQLICETKVLLFVYSSTIDTSSDTALTSDSFLPLSPPHRPAVWQRWYNVCMPATGLLADPQVHGTKVNSHEIDDVMLESSNRRCYVGVASNVTRLFAMRVIEPPIPCDENVRREVLHFGIVFNASAVRLALMCPLDDNVNLPRSFMSRCCPLPAQVRSWIVHMVQCSCETLM